MTLDVEQIEQLMRTLAQTGLSECAIESEGFSLRLWRKDIREAAGYLKQERGLCRIYSYMAVTNGIAGGYSPILIAFFRTGPGAAMYALLSVAEFLGRSLGGAVQYRVKLPAKKKFGFAFGSGDGYWPDRLRRRFRDHGG